MLSRTDPDRFGLLATAMVLPHFTPNVLLEAIDNEPRLRVPAAIEVELGANTKRAPDSTERPALLAMLADPASFSIPPVTVVKPV
jgi:hypothetical protein